MNAPAKSSSSRLHHAIAVAPCNDIAIDGSLSGKKQCIDYGRLRSALTSFQKIIGDIEPGQRPVGILANRSVEACVSVLACFLAGVPFVPLNPGFPEHRLKRIAELSGLCHIFHEGKHQDVAQRLGVTSTDASALIEDSEQDSFSKLFSPLPDDDRLAYQMFTSGSTGDPKGVPITARNLGAYVAGILDLIKPSPGQRFSQTFDLSFDLAMHDIFVCFTSGGTLVTASDMNLLMPASYIEKQRIDIWFSVPMLATIANRGSAMHSGLHRLKMALFCGEALPMDTARLFGDSFVEAQGALWNLYGPTEATIALTARNIRHVADGLSLAPIGAPFGRSCVAILQSDGAVICGPDRETEGELLLGGPQIFSGYNPPVDKDIFVECGGIRYYRSGDWVRFDGEEIHYAGRIDQQVKIRGYRVELGELETAFCRLFNVEAAAAVAVEQGGSNCLCLAYQANSDICGLDSLASELPEYMVPQAVQRLDQLPLNANGKIDRKALAALQWFD